MSARLIGTTATKPLTPPRRELPIISIKIWINCNPKKEQSPCSFFMLYKSAYLLPNSMIGFILEKQLKLSNF